MNITQSAITNAIKELEIELNVQLFERSSKGMKLTPYGREFLHSAYDILSRIERAGKFTSQTARVSGTVKLAVSYTVVGYFLPAHVERFQNLYPNIKLDIHETNREIIEEGLINHRYDMGVVLTSNLTNGDLHTETLFRSQRRLWLPYGHRFSEQRNVAFEEISKEPYIMLTIDEAAQTTMKYWSQTDYRPNVTLRTSSTEAVRSMVANGQGITILSDMIYRPWSLEGKRIVTATTTPEIPTMNIGLAWQKQVELSPASQAVMKYFRSTYSGAPSEKF